MYKNKKKRIGRTKYSSAIHMIIYTQGTFFLY